MPRTFEHEGVSWLMNDTRGYLDAGPACDECGACECLVCTLCGEPRCHEAMAYVGSYCGHGELASCGEAECIGLSVAYVCLDGGESLCTDCAKKAGLPI